MSETSAKQQQDEALSALFDGEASELELRRLLKTSADDSEVNNRWTRYQMISASMKNEVPAVPFADLSSSISAVIADEPAHNVGSSAQSNKKSFWSGVGRFAVAASVAGAVVLGVQFAPSDVSNNQIAESNPSPVVNKPIPSSIDRGLSKDTQVSTVSTNNVPVEKQVIINENTQQQLKKEVEPQVNRLMHEHAQNASQNTQQGVLPYARVPESSESK